jgi:hypothetical protein
VSWTCQRQTGGVTCKHVNPNRKQNCEACGKRKPPRKRPAHLVALEDHDYESFIERTGGEFCSICGRKPNGVRKLHRDHDHRTGEPRGLLCFPCNSALRVYMTAEWLRQAADYLDRHVA